MLAWAPQPGPQTALLACPYDEIFFGGARGGGKTDGLLGRVGYRALKYSKAYNAVIFRSELPQADDLIERSHAIFGAFGRYNSLRKEWRFDNGARIRFRPLRTVADAAKYQGQNITDAVFEEAGNYPTPDPIMRIFGALRSASGTPTSLVLTGNPGGPGQSWIRDRYIEPHPDGYKEIVTRFPNGAKTSRVFIPSKVRDNRIMLENDPNYVNRLRLVGNEKLVRAWLDGDWSAIEGQFFDEWDEERHVVEPFKLPEDCVVFRSIDWGFAAPFSVGWWAVLPESHGHLDRGALVRFREWYGASGPNRGLRLNADEVAREVLERSQEKASYTVADPAMWGTDTGPSPAEEMMRAGLPLRRADNRRIASVGHLGGWNQMRQRLKNNAIATFSTCTASRKFLPLMQHDPDRPEDVDTNSEDHVADEWRYACMSRPWTKEIALPPEEWRAMPTAQELFFDELRDEET